MNIVKFLEARLAEDRATAELAIGSAAFGTQTGVWEADNTQHIVFAIVDNGAQTQVANMREAWDGRERIEHVARWDPARALREVEAKEAVLYAHTNVERCWFGMESVGAIEVMLHMVEVIAAVYSDHPDYDPKWTPFSFSGKSI